ncbi:formylglycine-generating enzyme family protein [Flavobacterium sp. ASW18X]|uniref:formylglycine-generating enzyme family protein n=1 Tax=Flavobacterium sp. ASW18X TaxID=2572595 RepID=UPI0010ADF63D|nr:formylglycine-generating enzyme family protein [Flavobacterium sp. ASW18X]TKD63536.1 formylglycine-generating enzyme family protein [Flavobacterium sp. ASW18X]
MTLSTKNLLIKTVLLSFIFSLFFTACKEKKIAKDTPQAQTKAQVETPKILIKKPATVETPEGMVWIPGGTFNQGALEGDTMAMNHEKPRHQVTVDGFFMDIHEVTNAQFREFVTATGYVTVAERKIDWEEMKQQLPPNTPKPHDSILQPGALIFKKTKSSVPNLYDYSQWWEWKIGANWKHPNGPESTIEGKDNEPVVQVAYEDALAYCEWAGKRLPTEAEWEYAARAQKENAIFFWGNDHSQLNKYANTWEGEFPKVNNKEDGYERRAPVMSYPKNNFGLYDMAGNVWEWTTDWYNINYYKELANKGTIHNPQGPTAAYNPNNPMIHEKVIKGGSFLCSDSYCASYRISARMATSMDSGAEHVGFRAIKDIPLE